MAAVDLMDLVNQRIEDIDDEDEDLETDAAYFIGEHGPWGFIVITSDGEPIGFEFIESGDSWRRPEAMDEYNAAASLDLEVLVIVPDEAFAMATEMIYGSGNPSITISNYHAMELTPRPLAS
ncbi:MAG TPA: hypothetical protein PKX52_00210 [Methanomassiliicoccaceae archaeon]|nr:hypothetical protein [Methanomassiliicoccaceae archaeon]HPT73306.1 hypothetical protein [Methanomassiliicoccaceae archaeon]